MTRKQHLQKLPLQKRLQAMENIRKDCLFASFQEKLNYENKNFALMSVFVFMNTRQGHDYWIAIDRKYFW